jgi:hypothetical protein
MTLMICNVGTATLSIALLCSVTLTPAASQSQPSAAIPGVEFSYGPTKQFEPIRQKLVQRRIKEKVQAFLSPLKLKGSLAIETAECAGKFYKPYKSDGSVTICYEFVQLVESLAPNAVDSVGGSLVTREMALVGPFVHELLHNVALAVFDLQQVPVWGNAEFAADNVAAFLMLQFGADVALKTTIGSAYFLNKLDSRTEYSVSYLAEIRNTVRQRYYNLLCIAVGSDPLKFSNFVPVNRPASVTDLPLSRLENCYGDAGEYEQVRSAFNRTILGPYIDPGLQRQVLATPWF